MAAWTHDSMAAWRLSLILTASVAENTFDLDQDLGEISTLIRAKGRLHRGSPLKILKRRVFVLVVTRISATVTVQ
jgi:hypothetical protein